MTAADDGINAADGTKNAVNASNSNCYILINGGTLAAVGSSGMVETPGSNSAQCVISYATNSTVSTGSKIELKDQDGEVLISFTTSKSFQSAILSCEGIEKGETYYLFINDTQVKSFLISSTITSVGTQSAGGDKAPGGDWGFNPGGIGGRR